MREEKSIDFRESNATSDALDLLAVQKTMQGQPRAFAELVDRYTPMLYSLAYRLLGSPEEAEDAVQEIFLRTFGSLHRFRLSARFYTWLYTIALNWLRSRHRRLRLRSRREVHPGAEDMAVYGGNPQPQPPDLLANREAEQLLQEAIGSLSTRYRSVFVLRQAQGLSISEISAVLKLPEGTVKTRLFRARRMLRDRLFRRAEQ